MDGPSPKEPQCLAVMYHYVHDDEPLPRPSAPGNLATFHGLSSAEFTAQVDFLCRVMEPIAWPALYAGLCGARPLPRRCFLLTFDDGLTDHARTVLPALTKRGLHGAFFIPGAALASNHLLPAHAIHLLLATLDEEALEQELSTYLTRHGGDWADLDARVDVEAARATYHYETPVRARLKYLLTFVLPVELRNEAVETLFRRHIGSTRRWARNWYLSWDDLREMHSLGHTIGGHGFTHEPFSRITPTQCRRDARQVAEALRNGFGPDLRPFSYPYGWFDNDAIDACRRAGFAHAFTTERHWITPGTDAYRLPRVDTIDVSAVLEERACIPS